MNTEITKLRYFTTPASSEMPSKESVATEAVTGKVKEECKRSDICSLRFSFKALLSFLSLKFINTSGSASREDGEADSLLC